MCNSHECRACRSNPRARVTKSFCFFSPREENLPSDTAFLAWTAEILFGVFLDSGRRVRYMRREQCCTMIERPKIVSNETNARGGAPTVRTRTAPRRGIAKSLCFDGFSFFYCLVNLKRNVQTQYFLPSTAVHVTTRTSR